MARTRNPHVSKGEAPGPFRRERLEALFAHPLSLGLLLAAMTLALYGRTAWFQFIDLDDAQYIVNNPHIQNGLTWEGLRWAFSGSSGVGYWHPLTWVSLMLDVTLFGQWAGGFHLTNAGLHSANVVLLYFLLHRIVGNKWIGLAVAGIFAVHPLHVESVAWITARKDVLSMLFGLVALHCYVAWVDSRRLSAFIMLHVAYGASLMAKPMFVTLPALLLLLDYWPLGRIDVAGRWPRLEILWQRVREKWLLLLMAPASVLATLASHPEAYGAFEPSLGLRLANAVVSYVEYASKFFWPTNLAIVYPFPKSIQTTTLAINAAILVVVSATAIYNVRRRPYLLVCWLWYLVSLLPVIIPPRVGLHVATADRWGYLPSWGIYLACVLLTAELIGRIGKPAVVKQVVIVALLLPVGVLSWLTFHQLTWWQDKYTIYERALAVTDGNYFVMNNYGVLLMRRQEPERAETLFRRSLSIFPNYGMALGNMGILCSGQGRFGEAIDYFKRALVEDSRPGGSAYEDYYGIGYCLAQLQQYGDAESYYHKAIELKPDYALAYNDLGNIALLRGEVQKAVGLFAKAVEIKPDYAVARANLLRARQLATKKP
jgi:Tfp pilus assembly protein PilF